MELYTLYIQDSSNFAEFTKFILLKLKSLLQSVNVVCNNEDRLVVSTKAFAVDVRSKSLKMDITKEEYNMDLDYELIFDLYFSEDESTNKMMMKFMKALINKNDRQCIVLFNGCRSVLERRDKVILGDSNYLPYLDIEYMDQKLE